MAGKGDGGGGRGGKGSSGEMTTLALLANAGDIVGENGRKNRHSHVSTCWQDSAKEAH